MNNDIKEILDYLKDEKWDYNPGEMTPYKVFFMEERDKLLDYITNLQQENERLKEENKHIFANVNDDVLLRSNAMNYAEAQDYKSRIEKAVEYIKECYRIYDIDDNAIQDILLDILNGKGSDE